MLRKSQDYGEGFYCTLDNDALCRKQAYERAKTKAFMLDSKPVIITVNIDTAINNDPDLSVLYFDCKSDYLDWAKFVSLHRAKKTCDESYCSSHPDIVIGPVADGISIDALAERVLKERTSVEESSIRKSIRPVGFSSTFSFRLAEMH